MTWQAEVGGSQAQATDYRDLLVKTVAVVTSRRVATVAVAAGGASYTDGDILEMPLPGGFLTARFQATVVGGAVTALALRNSGAYSDRVASAVVNAGGTGYVDNEIVEIDDGTAREKAKFRVTNQVGGVVQAGGVALFETGGAYSANPPATAATTTSIGPSGSGGTGLTLDLTMAATPATSGVATTGGTGTGCTVNVTYAETGWTAVRNVNNRTENGLTDEKEVTLRGDSAGTLNKPFVHAISLTRTSGGNTRFAIWWGGSPFYNPAQNIGNQIRISPGIDTGNQLQANAPYLLCDQDPGKLPMNFWVSADDTYMFVEVDTNSQAASTDDREYHHSYAGYYEPATTEVEDPIPLFVGASARISNIDPSQSDESITSLLELVCPAGTVCGANYYSSEQQAWINVSNSVGAVADQERNTGMFPLVQITEINNPANTSDRIAFDGPVVFWQGIGSTSRASPTVNYLPAPGTTPQHVPVALGILSRPGGAAVDQSNDKIVGLLKGVFWVYNADNNGNPYTQFSEDFVNSGTDRLRVFASHVQKERYHYVGILENV